MTDRRTGIAIGLVLGVVAVALFVFVFSDDTVDSPAVDDAPQAENTGTGAGNDEGADQQTGSDADGNRDGEGKNGKAGESGDGAASGGSAPPEPSIPTIVVVNGQPQGGVQTIETDKGAEVAFEVRADAPEHVHVHGYDLFEDVGPGMPAEFRFPAEIDGVFEVELEDSAVPIIELRVNP